MQNFSYFIAYPSTMLGRWQGLSATGLPSLLLHSDFEQEEEKKSKLICSYCQNYYFPHTQSTLKDTGQLQAIPPLQKNPIKSFLSYPSTAALLSFTTSHDTPISILSQGGLKCKHHWVAEVSLLQHGQRKGTGKMEMCMWDQAKKMRWMF